MPTATRIAEHRTGLTGLLPPGKLWTRIPGGVRDNLVLGIAVEGAKFEELARALIDEADPRTTSDLLTDWERWLGLPDACIPDLDALTLDERRDQIVARLQAVGGQSVQFFIDLAATLGLTVTITEFTPFFVGESGMGDPVGGDEWQFAWQVNVPTAGPEVVLECLFRRVAPAHTIVVFDYT